MGCILSSSCSSAEMDSISSVSLSSTRNHDVSQISDLKAHAFAATLFPVSAILSSCFGCQKTSTDASVCQSVTLAFRAGPVFIFIIAVLSFCHCN